MMAFEAKNKDNIKVNDMSPILDPLIKLSTNSIRPLLLVCAGMISMINPCN